MGYWVKTNMLNQGTSGIELKQNVLPKFSTALRVYLRSDASGMWIETSYESQALCNTIKTNLASIGIISTVMYS